ncbi:porin [Pusillimonas sp. T2]|uniref:porin n=1 Tax=Pusillimonas sp. T2 TaxID=1548123 RepID=UPI000B9D3E1D|nr:porin [Pusillimonas sp. T2]OXR49393.1 porin [Pusillimonas sp. T2]
MKLKALTVGLALSFPALVAAQGTSVTLYGTIDTAINYVNHIGTNGEDYVGMNTQTNSWPSMWGLRGSEKISDNLEAVFKLESGFNSAVGNSNQGGRLFGREAWVGLKGDWGQVALGRQYSMLFWSMLNSDIMGPNAHGLGGLDSYIPDRRQDNAISYRGTFSGVTVGAHYAKGRNDYSSTGTASCGVDVNQENACASYSGLIGYDAANWGVNVAYDALRAGQTATTTPSDEDRRLAFNAWAKFDALKLGLVYINRKNDINPTTALGERSDLWSLGAAYALTPAVTLDGSVNYINFKNASESSKSWLYVARVKYALSKRTSVYASAAYVNNRGQAASSANSGVIGTYAPAAGNNQTAFMTGVRHNF